MKPLFFRVCLRGMNISPLRKSATTEGRVNPKHEKSVWQPLFFRVCLRVKRILPYFFGAVKHSLHEDRRKKTLVKKYLFPDLEALYSRF